MRISFLLLSLVLGCVLSRPQVPDQVQQFLQQSFLEALQGAVEEGGEQGQELVDHIANLTATGGSQEEGGGEQSAFSAILSNITKTIEQNETEEAVTETAMANEVETTTMGVTEMEMTTLLPTPKPTTKKPISYLDEEATQKLKSLCPELAEFSEDRVLWHRYHEPSKKCFRYGFQGPCGKGMKLFIKEAGSIYGECDCRVDIRLHIYDKESDACYKIYSQGPCTEGMFIDVDKEGQATCSPNPCAEMGEDWVKVKGICTELRKPNPSICGTEREVVDFVKNKSKPACVLTQDVATGVGLLPCRPGSSIQIHGKCHLTQWDFGDDD